MNKLDKKQIPQFAALCVLSAGAFGYFVVKMVTPSPAAAGTRPHPVTSAALIATASSPTSAAVAEAGKAGESKREAGKLGTGPDAAPAEAEEQVPAPTPGMRDPFVIGYVDPKTQPAIATSPALPAAQNKAMLPLTKPAKAAGPQVASIHEVGPVPVGVSALPFGLKGLPPLGAASPLPVTLKKAEPEAPAAPAWTVTGVLQSGTGQIAILRSGAARRIVHTGDFVDSVYRVTTVTRSAVILRHGKMFYHLTLGTPKAASPAVPPLTTPARAVFPSAPIPSPAPAPGRSPQDAVLTPADYSAGAETRLAQVIQAALLLAGSSMAPVQAEVDACLASFRDRQALPPRTAMQFPDGPALKPSPNDARARLDWGRDLYQSGNHAEGRAQWQCVLAMEDLAAANEAGKLLDRYN